MQLRAIVPNTLTSLNLVCGCVGIILAFQEELAWSGIMIGIAAVLDFFDGFAARLLKVEGELGKQLDSLADAVTFGVLPAIIIHQLILISLDEYFTPFRDRSDLAFWLPLVGLLIAVFSILRLAIFNIDTRQSENFLGVPTPANAIMVGAIPVILDMQYQMNMYVPPRGALLEAHVFVNYLDPFDEWLIQLLFNPWLYVWFSVIMSVMLVARIPLFSLKFKSLKWKPNKVRFSFLIGVAVLGLLVGFPYLRWQLGWEWVWLIDLANLDVKNFPFLDWSIIPMIILWYILLSILILPFSNKRTDEISS